MDKKFIVKPVTKDDLLSLAQIYVKLYDKADIGEHWTIETAYQLLAYWYRQQPDLFLCAYDDTVPVAVVMSGVKPWWDGIHITDTEVFVSDDYQKQGIATELYKQHYRIAIDKYQAVTMIEKC